eukprot:g10519.t1
MHKLELTSGPVTLRAFDMTGDSEYLSWYISGLLQTTLGQFPWSSSNPQLSVPKFIHMLCLRKALQAFFI